MFSWGVCNVRAIFVGLLYQYILILSQELYPKISIYICLSYCFTRLKPFSLGIRVADICISLLKSSIPILFCRGTSSRQRTPSVTLSRRNLLQKFSYCERIFLKVNHKLQHHVLLPVELKYLSNDLLFYQLPVIMRSPKKVRSHLNQWLPALFLYLVPESWWRMWLSE